MEDTFEKGTLDRENTRYLIDMKFAFNLCETHKNTFMKGYYVGYFDALIQLAKDLDYISNEEYAFLIMAMFSVLQKS